MLWLSSWYQQPNNEQSQEPFNDQYEAADEEEDWVKVIDPVIKRQPLKEIEKEEETQSPSTTSQQEQPINDNINNDENEAPIKRLSRQERRAKARLIIREKKKQTRNAALVSNRNRGRN